MHGGVAHVNYVRPVSVAVNDDEKSRSANMQKSAANFWKGLSGLGFMIRFFGM